MVFLKKMCITKGDWVQTTLMKVLIGRSGIKICQSQKVLVNCTISTAKKAPKLKTVGKWFFFSYLTTFTSILA